MENAQAGTTAARSPLEVYSYLPQTGEYEGKTWADPSPMEEGIYHFPAHSTGLKPPLPGAHEAAVFDAASQAWSLVPDWRGVALYSTADGSKVAAALGQMPEQLSATDVPRPSAQHVWHADAWVLDADLQAAADTACRTSLAVQIDDAVAAIYTRFERFSREYEMREAQAQAYKDAGYTGEVPLHVAAFATPAGMAPKAAADLILAQSAALRAAVNQFGVLRMRKYEVLAAKTVAEAEAAAQTILSAIAQVGAALK